MLYACDIGGIFIEKMRWKRKLFVGSIGIPSLHDNSVDVHVLISTL